MNRIREKLGSYFDFSKTETQGVLVLCILLLTTALFPGLLNWYASQNQIVNPTQDLAQVDQIVALLQKQTPSRSSSPSRPLPILDINTADTQQLEQVRGIGPVLAARIVKYRAQLGGWVTKAQYKEIYRLSAASRALLEKCTYIRADFKPRQLNINIATTKALAAHPYLTDQQAQQIVHYRSEQGPFVAIADLAGGILDQATFTRVAPYLTVS